METNENQFTVSNSVYNPQVRTLLTIKDFSTSLETYRNKVQAATQNLIANYERGLQYFSSESAPEDIRNGNELLNEVRVHANHLNHYLMLVKEKSEENREFPFKGLWKEFETRLNMLKDASQKFENLGAKNLSGEQMEQWENEIATFEKTALPEIQLNAQGVKLVLEFMAKYTPEQLEKISRIILATIPEGSTFRDAKEYEAAFLKSMREFQKEFEQQDNLWDSILEILAGGVHPSPSERVMLEKWIDGDEKIREDM